jgi:hypothetical protein
MNKTLKVLAVVLAAGLLVMFLGMALLGCASGPGPMYTALTNVVSEAVVPKGTNTVTATNWVERIVLVTNEVAATAEMPAHQVVIVQPVRDGVLTTSQVVTYQTNQELSVTYKLKEGVAAGAGAVGSIVNTFMPGVGTMVSQGALGLAAIVGGLFARKYKKEGTAVTRVNGTLVEQLQKTADAGAKIIEVYRNVAQSTPQGAAADQKLLKWMQEHQREMGIADLMANAVAGMDDEHAQMLAQKILAETARGRGSASQESQVSEPVKTGM